MAAVACVTCRPSHLWPPEAQAMCRRVDSRAHSIRPEDAAAGWDLDNPDLECIDEHYDDMDDEFMQEFFWKPEEQYGAGGGWAPTPPLAGQHDMDGTHTVLEADRSLQWGGRGGDPTPPEILRCWGRLARGHSPGWG